MSKREVLVKKAVISTGGKQYIVSEGDEIDIELIKSDGKSAEFDSLAVFDDDKINIGTPLVTGSKVTAVIVEQSMTQPKVTSIRYKAKKRVKKIRGHRQQLAKIKIQKIK